MRYIYAITNDKGELLSIANKLRPRTTDFWEAVYFESSTGDFDNKKELLQSFGFSIVVTTEELRKFEGLPADFNTVLGYFDERSLKFL